MNNNQNCATIKFTRKDKKKYFGIESYSTIIIYNV